MSVVPYRVYPTIESLQEEAAGIMAEALQPSHEGRIVTLALSGGSTPVGVHQRLAMKPGIDWSNVHVFWGDERTVPPDHDDCNFRMAFETLLDAVDIPARNVHRMHGEVTPDDAAREYEATLRSVFEVDETTVPRFDMIVLGMGPDGHTASLFPGTEALDERTRLVVANDVPQLETTRLTLTFPVLNAAKHVLFLATGSDKADPAFRSVTETGEVPPAGRVRPANGSLLWLLDANAGALLEPNQRKHQTA